MNTTYSNTQSQGASTLPLGDTPALPGIEEAAAFSWASPEASEPEPAVAVSETLLPSKAILVHLALTQIGRTRQVRETYEIARTEGDNLQAVNTNKDSVRITKTLFKCAELKAIEKLDDEIRAFVARKCLPSPMRRKSVYLIPLGLVEEVDARLQAFAAERVELIAAFEKVYPRLLVKARRTLGDLFDRHDYPRRENVSACFRLEWRFIALGVPDALGEINSQIFDRERQKAAEAWAETQTEIQQLLRVRLKSMMERLKTSLQPKADGSKKKFFKTTLENINAFMADFHALNITNDAQLAQIAASVRDLMQGIEPETLRDSQDLRGVVLEGAANLEQQLTTLIVDRPKRLISLEDD